MMMMMTQVRMMMLMMMMMMTQVRMMMLMLFCVELSQLCSRMKYWTCFLTTGLL